MWWMICIFFFLSFFLSLKKKKKKTCVLFLCELWNHFELWCKNGNDEREGWGRADDKSWTCLRAFRYHGLLPRIFISLQSSLYSNVRRVCNGRTQPTGETQEKISLLFFFIPKTREGIKEKAVHFSFVGLDFCCGGYRQTLHGRKRRRGQGRGTTTSRLVIDTLKNV